MKKDYPRQGQLWKVDFQINQILYESTREFDMPV